VQREVDLNIPCYVSCLASDQAWGNLHCCEAAFVIQTGAQTRWTGAIHLPEELFYEIVVFEGTGPNRIKGLIAAYGE
jgi:hypothetical protein